MHNLVPMSFCLSASLSLEIIPRHGLPGSKSKCICNFARYCQILLHKSYIILPSQLQCMKVPSVQSSPSVMSDSVTPWTAAHQACLSITSSWSLLRLCPSSRWCHPTIFALLSPSPPAFNLSQHQGLFQWGSPAVLCIRWPKYWSFSFSISPSNEYSGLISFRNNWFDILAVQGTLKHLLQHHSSKASILWHSAFFMVPLSHPYLTTGKTIALTRRTFVGKVMSLLFNMLSRFVIAFLPRSVF